MQMVDQLKAFFQAQFIISFHIIILVFIVKGLLAMGIEKVKAKYEEQLARLPNVIAVGVGTSAGKKIIRIFVTQKVPEEALAPKEIIPKMLDGYETDVDEIGAIKAQNDQ